MGIVITKDTNFLKVDYGASATEFKRRNIRLSLISEINPCYSNNDVVFIMRINEHHIAINWNDVDTIDGVAPTSRDDLESKLLTLVNV